MTRAYVLLIAGILMIFTACKDDAPTGPSNNDDPGNNVEMSTLQKFAQTWILSETYENGVQKTSNGTGEYLYSEDGVFFFKNGDDWVVVGNYEFTGSDSTAFDMTFMGTNNPVRMQINTLTESDLETEFVTNGKTYNYNYTR